MSELKANELRIGNLVYKDYPDGKEIVVVEKLSKMFVNGLGLSGISPIPLTEEWLIKFGFKLTNDEGDVKYYDFINNSDYSIVFDHSEIALHYNTKNGYYCIMYDDDKLKHVHQLQNLYFALTGKELQQKINQNLNENETNRKINRRTPGNLFALLFANLLCRKKRNKSA